MHPSIVVSLTFSKRGQLRNLAKLPYEANLSAASTIPPLNRTPSTDVPVVTGVLRFVKTFEVNKSSEIDHKVTKGSCYYLL